ncbi:hypothetical protein CVT24_002566 [Panaeolus cyanescens]|uniref:Integrase core domain-containing protein n=1 Tax=Panaeolus cyanescens TaxID=181874 RepID=A0A409YU08_9AGAR|nr:hypothetical protein CVT24_002566 [Panaeolus cyanescens]
MTVVGIPIDVTHICARRRSSSSPSQGTSILADSLLAALQGHFRSAAQICHPLFAKLLLQSSASASISAVDIQDYRFERLSTSQGVEFGYDQYSSSVLGYRPLISLPYNVHPAAPAEHFDPLKELLSVGRASSHPPTQQFFETWEGLGVDAERHFILIIEVAKTPDNRNNHSLQPSIGQEPSGTPLEFLTENLEAQNSQFSTQSPESPSANTLLSEPCLDLHELLAQFTHNEIQDASFIRGRYKQFYHMIQNFNRLQDILIALGLPQKCLSGDEVIPFSSQVTAEDILKSLKWSLQTYQNKYKTYSWAEEISRLKLKGNDLIPQTSELSHQLCDALRDYYFRLEAVIHEVASNPQDSNAILLIRQDLDDFSALVNDQYSVLEERDLQTLQTNITLMRSDLDALYHQSLDLSNATFPEVRSLARTGRPGQPRIVLDPHFLAWSYNRRSLSALARFFGVSRTTLRTRLAEIGILPQTGQPGVAHLEIHSAINTSYDSPPDIDDSDLAEDEVPSDDPLLEPQLANFQDGHNDTNIQDPSTNSFERTGTTSQHHSAITDAELDDLVINLRHQLITGLRASSNNRADTVLDVFLNAINQYGVPSRLRGDHGTENVRVAAWMEHYRGRGRGSYIWGRSVHNVRIERLWVDIKAQLGQHWADFFDLLELQHGLDVNSANHIWLLHHLFLPQINQNLQFFADSWNEHRVSIRRGTGRSPMDMFHFDMTTHGDRGVNVEEVMTPEELEVYGIDWEGLDDDEVRISRQVNNPFNEEESTWTTTHLANQSLPANLSEVRVDDPFDNQDGPVNIAHLHHLLGPYLSLSAFQGTDVLSRVHLWTTALACAQQLDPTF